MSLPAPPASPSDPSSQPIERAILDLRCGLPVVMRDAGHTCLVAPVEGIAPASFAEMRNGARGPTHLMLSGHRLGHLGLTSPAVAGGVALQLDDVLADIVHWAADPLARWPAGRPLLAATDTERAALAMLQRGGLIPAAICAVPGDGLARTLSVRLDRAELLAVEASRVFAHCRAAPVLRRISEAEVPLDAGIRSRFVVFRELHAPREHVAILVGDDTGWSASVPVRVHSACLTGDLFGSIRCDCGSQLRNSVALLEQRGGGVLLYLAQEGRGIGLANKMRAYQIQDDGLDTIDANQVLGFGPDERHYAVAREMLVQLGVTRIDLLTNNPAKLVGLQQAPIEVTHRSSIYGLVTKENRRYLVAKARRSGHWLDDLLPDLVDTEVDEGVRHNGDGAARV